MSVCDDIDWRGERLVRTSDGWRAEVYRSQDCKRWFGEVKAADWQDLTKAVLQVGTEAEAQAFCQAALTFLRGARVTSPSTSVAI